MKFLSKNNGVITILLIMLLLVSSFFIIQLEMRAASLQSRLDEHHEQLKKNSDELDNLNTFMRRVGNNLIYIDKNMLQIGTGKSSLFFKGDIFTVEMRSGKLVLELSEPDKLIQLINESSKIKLKDDKIKIEAKGDITIGPSAEKDLGYNKKEDYIYMRNGESRIALGEIFHKDGKSVGNGINLIGKTGGSLLTVLQDKIMLYVPSKDGQYKLWIDPTKQLVGLIQGQSSIIMRKDSVLVRAKQDISLGTSSEKDLGYNKKEDFIYMRNGESRILLGEIIDNDGKSHGNAVRLVGKRGGPNLIVMKDRILLYVPSKDGKYKLWIDPTKQLVGLTQGQSSIIMRKDEITIEALGDINITSKNGKVNINGKR